MPELPHPEFPESVDSRVALAVLGRLVADPALHGYFTGGIFDAEAEELLLSSTLAYPSLAVLINATDERRAGSGRQAELDVELLLVVVQAATATTGTGGFFRSRLIDQVKAILAVGGGELRDDDGRRLTEALLRFERLGPPAHQPAAGAMLTTLRVVFSSLIHEARREFIG